MSAIFRRELHAYFTSPIAYACLAVYYLFSGIFVFFNCILASYADLRPVILSMFIITLIIVPLLTMRLFSEERRNRTDQALLTAPVSVSGIVMGKFLAAFVVYMAACAIMLVYALIFGIFVPLEWNLILYEILGMALLGASLLSIGTLVSTLTENQAIAAIISFGAMMMLVLMDSITSNIQNGMLKDILGGFSFYQRYNQFLSGEFNIANVLFFLSVTVLFLFYTTRLIERRRYAG